MALVRVADKQWLADGAELYADVTASQCRQFNGAPKLQRRRAAPRSAAHCAAPHTAAASARAPTPTRHTRVMRVAHRSLRTFALQERPVTAATCSRVSSVPPPPAIVLLLSPRHVRACSSLPRPCFASAALRPPCARSRTRRAQGRRSAVHPRYQPLHRLLSGQVWRLRRRRLLGSWRVSPDQMLRRCNYQRRPFL